MFRVHTGQQERQLTVTTQRSLCKAGQDIFPVMVSEA